jgi:DNA/RNA-binding domain of Phe-tRNA-synthetase-like protein
LEAAHDEQLFLCPISHEDITFLNKHILVQMSVGGENHDKALFEDKFDACLC